MKEQYQLPILTEKDEDGFYVVECPVFSGCYTQGRTMDEAMENIREVIDLCLEEQDNKEALENLHPQALIFSTLTYA
jgi:predicted RNase H-like HicB family nuclease